MLTSLRCTPSFHTTSFVASRPSCCAATLRPSSPPQLSHPLPMVFGVATYLYHYFLILVHFQWMRGANWGTNFGQGVINEEWMYAGYAISVFGQVLMLKQADTIPKSTLRSGFVWRG